VHFIKKLHFTKKHKRTWCGLGVMLASSTTLIMLGKEKNESSVFYLNKQIQRIKIQVMGREKITWRAVLASKTHNPNESLRHE
jgi:hypothetical protein